MDTTTTTTPAAPAASAVPRRPKPHFQFVSWSRPAALRALRTAVILPLILAFTSKVIGNPQMATYAAFGTFANLVLASFSGTRRDKFVAHLGLGVVGSGLLAVGTLVSASTPTAAVVTLAVTFVVLLAGVTGPNAAAGGLAAMLAYVLSAASPGVGSMIPSQLEGWWLATAVAAIAVVATTPRMPGNQLRTTAAASARALAREIEATATDSSTPALRAASAQAQTRLQTLFNSSPYRPTGLATADQALGSLTELLEWVATMVGDTAAGHTMIGTLCVLDRELLLRSSAVLDAVAGMLLGEDAQFDLDGLERLRRTSAESIRDSSGEGPDFVAAIHASFHARTIAVAVRTAAADTLVATRRASLQSVDRRRLTWIPGPALARTASPPAGTGDGGRVIPPAEAAIEGSLTPPPWAAAANLVSSHASVRSVWVRNSARGAVAVAAAVTVADLTNVQHGFWIVLGTLSVLRTTATATGGTALRALLGTTIGFLLGAAVIVAVGTDTTVLWIVLPVAVLIASYAPGVAPFAAGQAAFTAMLLVLYNLLLPVGWRVGVVRVEDIAVGCGISLVVGVLFWPRGATAVVADDLDDAFRSSARYLVASAEWALGLGDDASHSGRSAVVTGLRLEDALRAFLNEQGAKLLPKEDLWALVGAAQRLRLTAAALAELPAPPTTGPVGEALRDRARTLGAWYGDVATHIRTRQPPRLVALPPEAPLDSASLTTGHRRACQITVDQHLRHLLLHHGEVIDPAQRLALAAKRAWWHPVDPAAPVPAAPVPVAPSWAGATKDGPRAEGGL